MNSSDDNPGLTLLRKWHAAEKLIRATFSPSPTVETEFSFIAFGKIADPQDAVLHVSGKDFELICDLRAGTFKHVISDDLMREHSPSLVGKEPESIEIEFSWGERLLLTVPSALPS
jgi:hypothetical protein